MTGDLRPRQRALLIVLGFIGLVVGVAAGLARLGYRVPSFALSATPWHGPLMIGGFFGVVIALEIPTGAAVAGPFNIPQRKLDALITQALASASPRPPVVH